MIRYSEFQPSPSLSTLVACYWILEGHGCGTPEPIVPDGCVELIFHYGTPFTRHHSTGASERQPPAVVAGQITSPAMLSTPKNAGVAAVRLRSSAAAAVLRVPAESLTDQICGLEGVLRVGRLVERLADAHGDLERIALLESWLNGLHLTEPRTDLAAAVELIVATGGNTDLDAVARHSELSRRQLERLFPEHVGLAPKTFARIIRLRRAVKLARRGQPLASVAAACGYYDQPHMTRDFRVLLNGSPKEWQEMTGALSSLFAD